MGGSRVAHPRHRVPQPQREEMLWEGRLPWPMHCWEAWGVSGQERKGQMQGHLRHLDLCLWAVLRHVEAIQRQLGHWETWAPSRALNQ